jgi:chlorobactene glucosyltransferase
VLTIALQPIPLNVLAGLLWFVVLAWLISIALTLYGISRQKTLSPIDDLGLQPNDAPLVSVLIPARNEEHRVLADCIRSILDQDYARFEIIAVNDHSTDATGAILESLAKADSRLRVIEGEEPPSGWLGKAYAMHQAFMHARGEWILATDADMIFERSALRTAVAMTLERETDAITLIPYFEAKSFWERVMIPTWAWVLLIFTVFYRVDNPNSRRAVGIGGFFLMRRAMLERAGGYEALKDEVLEDVRLAELIKHSGGSLLAEYAPSLLRTRMYRNFDEMWECCTKNWFAGMNFSLPLAMWCVFSIYLIAVVPPLLALASAIGIVSSVNTDLWRLFIPAVMSWLMQVLILLIFSIRSGVNPAYALTAPLGLGLLYAMLFDSTIRITRGKGVRWKGRRIYERAGVSVPKLRSAASRFSKAQKKEGMPG